MDREGFIPRSTKWRMLTWSIYAVLVLITMRIIYRFVEFSQGATSSNPILTHESYTYGLDALPMLLAVVLLNIVHPGLVLKGPESDFPRQTRKEKKATKREKKEAKEARKQEKKDRKRGIVPREEVPMAENRNQDRFATYTVGEYQEFEDERSRVREV